MKANESLSVVREKVTTIIPTIAEKQRKISLLRAIDSALHDELVESEVIVVVNGAFYDPEVLEQLKLDGRIKVVCIKDGNVSLARYTGIQHSTGEYFGFLDDDDEFLPNALSIRVAEIQKDPSIDVVVSNGYIRYNIDELLVEEALVEGIKNDPLRSFLDINWFASPASLFRKCSVGEEVFKIKLQYFEWSYLFYKLSMLQKNIVFFGAVTYRVYSDSPQSASKSQGYHTAYPEFLKDVHSMSLPKDVRRSIWRKYQTALNGLSYQYLQEGKVGDSLRYHVRCLTSGGWRYIPYTREILTGLFGRQSAA